MATTAELEPVTRAQVFRAYPTSEQQVELLRYMSVAGRLWNELVDYRKMLGQWHDRRWAPRQVAGNSKGDSYTGELSRNALAYWVKLARSIEPEPWATIPSAILHGVIGEFSAGEKSYMELSKLWRTPTGRKTLTGPPRRPGIRSPHTGPLTIRWQVQDGSGRCPIDKLLRVNTSGSVRWVTLHVPGLGEMRVRAHRRLPDDAMVGQVVLAYDRMSCWRVTLQYQTRNPTQYNAPDGSVLGVDIGVASTVVTSQGQAADVPSWTRREVERTDRCRQSMARSRHANPCPADQWVAGPHGRPRLLRGHCTCAIDGGACWKTSTRYKARKTAVAKMHRRRERRVNDAVHKISARLATEGELVVFEQLDIAAMSSSARGDLETPGRNVKAKAGLNRQIRAQSWARVIKASEGKARLVERRPARNTSRRCPACGHIHADNRPTQATFSCRSCGFKANADWVGAWNVAHWDRTNEDMAARAAPPQDADTSGPSGRHVDEAPRLPTQTTVATRFCDRPGDTSNPQDRSQPGQRHDLPATDLTRLVPQGWGVSTARNTKRNRRSAPHRRRSRRNGDPSGRPSRREQRPDRRVDRQGSQW